MIKAILTKPLDGQPEGTEREFDEADFATLKTMGAVREAPDLREDGPTIEEFVKAGYLPENYPPQGYASRSAPEEIAAAIAAAKKPVIAASPPAADSPATEPQQTQGKAAAAPANKMAPSVANKAAKA